MGACQARRRHHAPARRAARPRPHGGPAEPAGPHRAWLYPRRLQRRVWAHLPQLRRSSQPGLLRGPAAASVASRAAHAGGGPGRVSRAPRACLVDEDSAGSFRSWLGEGRAGGCYPMRLRSSIAVTLSRTPIGWSRVGGPQNRRPMGGRWVLWLPRGSPTRHAEFSQTGELGICCFRHAAPVMPVRQGISGVADRVVSAGDRLPDKPENCPARPRGLFDMAADPVWPEPAVFADRRDV